MTTDVGFIGLGLMGHPMCLRLMKSDVNVTIWNRTKHKTSALIAAGASLASNPKSVALKSEIVFLCLTDGAAVGEVIFGENGLVSQTPPKTIVDFSSWWFPGVSDCFRVLHRSNMHRD